MLDPYNRSITYLRISVTDRCNLRCIYCMPEEGIKLLPHNDILTFDEIVEFVRVAVELGVNKVRITGGEPLVRRGIIDLVKMISAVPGINDLSITTNGILLSQFAKPLFEAGVKRVNISLDTINPEKFRFLTRGGDINAAINGILTAKEVGFSPIKINCVVNESPNETDAKEVKAFAVENGLVVRFIPKMDLNDGVFGHIIGGEGGNCSSCNRLRLTANGIVKPCLFSDLGFNVRELGAREAIFHAIGLKPEKGTQSSQNHFYNIGG